MPTGCPPLGPSAHVCSRKCLSLEQGFCQPSCLPRSKQGGTSPQEGKGVQGQETLLAWAESTRTKRGKRKSCSGIQEKQLLSCSSSSLSFRRALFPVRFQFFTRRNSPVIWMRKEEASNLSLHRSKIFFPPTPGAHRLPDPAPAAPQLRTHYGLLPPEAFPVAIKVFTPQPQNCGPCPDDSAWSLELEGSTLPFRAASRVRNL